MQDSIDRGTAVEEKGPNASRNGLQTVTLLEGLEDGKYDAALVVPDEEKQEQKNVFHTEMILDNGPKPTTRIMNIFNVVNTWTSISAFSQLEWTEMDVWQYIMQENISLPSLYFAHKRRL